MTFQHPDYVPHYVAVYALLRRGDEFLCMRRLNTDYMEGYYGLPSGRVDPAETVIQAVLRETKEETGLTLNPSKLRLCHVQHRYEGWQEHTKQWVDFYYLVDSWDGEPVIAEPHKCDHLAWLSADTTEKLIPRLRPLFKSVLQGETFSFSGDWPEQQQQQAA
ncbi:MAG TPA: NUDIX domain-containing protein [Alphaproteobacteria bacterium]